MIPPPETSYDFVVFDYDGVIIDSLPAVSRAADELHDHLGIARASRAENIGRWTGPSVSDAVTDFCSQYGFGDRREEIIEFRFQAYVRAGQELTRVFDGIESLLGELVRSGLYLALATMKPRTEFEGIGSQLPGLEHFGHISRPHSHLDSPTTKTELVRRCIERIGDVTDSGVMVGDRASDIVAGRDNGLATIGVTWGAGTPEELRASRPDRLVDSVEELSQLLLLPTV